MKENLFKKTNMNHHNHGTIIRRRRLVSFVVAGLLLLQLLPYSAAQPNNNENSNSGGGGGGGGRTYQATIQNPNFKPSMTVTIIVLAVACTFIAFFSFYIRRCSRDIHMTGGSVRLTRTRPAPRGLDATIIETFPTFLYSVVKGLKIGKGVLECAVCLNEFEDDETLRLLPKCDHVFHPECIDAWLSSHTTCPVCRANLEESTVAEGTHVPAAESSNNDIAQDQNSSVLPETCESPSHVLIQVNDGLNRSDSKHEVINLTHQVPFQNRPIRSKSTRKGIISGRFPRSHSTGHSLVQPGENYERFTLKLPEDVRKQIMNGKLNRSTSCVTFPRQGSVSAGWANRSRSVRSGSTRGRNYQFGRFDRAGKSDRWGLPFFWRNKSVRSSKTGETSSVTAAKLDGMGQSSSTTSPV